MYGPIMCMMLMAAAMMENGRMRENVAAVKEVQ